MNMPQKKSFQHQHYAHCESGVMSLLLHHAGLPLSEPMAFGLAGALTFAYLPFVKLGGMPLVAYRSLPRAIIKGLRKNIGIELKLETFQDPARGTEALNRLLAEQRIVAAQTSVFWLPYFPEEMRFHFNAHNLIIYGLEDEEYLISDPVFEHPVRCRVRDLEKARFVKGVMAPKGLLYYITGVPAAIDYRRVLPAVIKKNARSMLKTPVPIAGIRGMRSLARTIGRLQKKDPRYARLFLGHIVRMQEEIGTGGAGFRFIYASFLQEAGKILSCPDLETASQMMTLVGDQWREFALLAVKAIRCQKQKNSPDFAALRRKLESVSQAEADVYRTLLAIDLINP